ncbi:MAG: Stk1 family PASTA domain-containing Ser/Thr kinase [Clostridiales Family XIII bacterium]|jgi:serine/threonine-protein kinase|nr:Stk1 family PASTA domain-containing Ser/Thr kinase [Clostridiales Family XIII bacterium]
MGYKILAGRYEIHEKIGDGGMAVVYKARDKLLNRMVAIKILRPEYVKDTTFVENFRRESMAAASLDTHPNIVTIYDVGKDGNIYYIVMELVDGKPLSDIIAERAPLDYHEVTHLGVQIASALSFAHKNNIIHRDVKPHNILVSGEGDNEVAKITDFGIARAVTDRTTVNDSNVIMGSVHYFSPEQGRGQYVDEKSDIYSLGIVLYEMLTGRVPFDADNPVAIAVMHMNEPIVPPSRLVKVVPPGLEQIILKATEKYQVNRFKSAADMVDALKNVSFITGTFTDARIQSIFQENEPAPRAAGKRYAEDAGLFAGLPDDGVTDDAFDAYDSRSEEGYYDETVRPPARGSSGSLIQKIGKNKKTIIIAAVLAVVLALTCAFLIIKGIGWLTGDNKVVVPNVVGKTEQQAKELIEEAGLKFEVDEEGVYSDIYEAGLVAAQSPHARLKERKKTVVRVSLSLGSDELDALIARLRALGYDIPDHTKYEDVITKLIAAGFAPGGVPVASDTDIAALKKMIEKAESEAETVQVPDLLGKTQAQAEYAAGLAGLVIGNRISEDSEKAIDTVIAQTPAANETVKKGSKIDITVSLGPRSKDAEMPNLIRMNEADAKAAIEALHLVVGTVTQAYSTEYAKGTVMWQQFQIGTKLSEGQTVDIKISNGPEEKESTVKITIDFSGAPADAFKLSVLQISADGSQNYLIRDADRFQSEGSEEISVTGKGQGKVIVYFNTNIQSKVYNIDFNTGNVS